MNNITDSLEQRLLKLVQTNPNYQSEILIAEDKETGLLKKDLQRSSNHIKVSEEHNARSIIEAFTNYGIYDRSLADPSINDGVLDDDRQELKYTNIGLRCRYGAGNNSSKWCLIDIDEADGKTLPIDTAKRMITYMKEHIDNFYERHPELLKVSFYPTLSSSNRLHVFVFFDEPQDTDKVIKILPRLRDDIILPMFKEGGFSSNLTGDLRPNSVDPSKKSCQVYFGMRLGDGTIDEDLLLEAEAAYMTDAEFKDFIVYVDNNPKIEVPMGNTAGSYVIDTDKENPKRLDSTFPIYMFEPITEKLKGKIHRHDIYYDIVSKLLKVAQIYNYDSEWLVEHTRSIYDYHVEKAPNYMSSYDWDKEIYKQHLAPILSQVGTLTRGYKLNNFEHKQHHAGYDPVEDKFLKNKKVSDKEIKEVISSYLFIAEGDKPYLIRKGIHPRTGVEQAITRKGTTLEYLNSSLHGKCFSTKQKVGKGDDKKPKPITAVEYLKENFPMNVMSSVTCIPNEPLYSNNDKGEAVANVFRQDRKILRNFDKNHPIITDVNALIDALTGKDLVECSRGNFQQPGDYLRMVLGSKIQQPEQLITSAMVFKGPVGAGKSLLVDMVVPSLLGHGNHLKSSANVLEKEFNFNFKDKQSIVLTEMTKLTSKMMGNWLPYITEHEVAYRPMRSEYTDLEKNYSTFFVVCNDIDISDKNMDNDDKLVIFDCVIDAKSPEHSKILDRVISYKGDDDAWDVYYSYLHSLDLSIFKPDFRSGINASKQRMVQENWSPLECGVMQLMSKYQFPFNTKAVCLDDAAAEILKALKKSERTAPGNLTAEENHIVHALIGEERRNKSQVKRAIGKAAASIQKDANKNPKDWSVRADVRQGKNMPSAVTVIIWDFDNLPAKAEDYREFLKTTINTGIQPVTNDPQAMQITVAKETDRMH